MAGVNVRASPVPACVAGVNATACGRIGDMLEAPHPSTRQRTDRQPAASFPCPPYRPCRAVPSRPAQSPSTTWPGTGGGCRSQHRQGSNWQ
eukprot:scaffold5412_cov129-Isochrysis_galbana.AAC.2